MRIVNRHVILSLLIGMAIALIGCASSANQKLPEEVTKHSSSPSEVQLASPGRVEGLTETISVGAATDGIIKTIHVQEGQIVPQGTMIAEIDCPDLPAALNAALSEAESAEQVRARLLHGSREEERRSAEQRTVAARAVLEQAQSHMKRIKVLVNEGVYAKAQLDEATRDVDVAEAKLKEATRNEELVKAPPLAEEVAKADADIQTARHKVRLAREKKAKCIVTAPISGTVVRVLMKAGESFSTLSPEPIVTMSDLSRRRVRAEIDERDIDKVKVGQKVSISVDHGSARPLSGVVSSLASTMGRKKILTGDPAEKADRDVLEAMIDLTQSFSDLPLGLRVTVKFLTPTQ